MIMETEKLRTELMCDLEKLEKVSWLHRRIEFALKQEDSMNERIAYRKLRAYRTDTDEDEIELPSVDDFEGRQERRAHIQGVLSDEKDDIEQREEELEDSVVNQLRKLLDRLPNTGDTKKSQVIALKKEMESNRRGDLIAEAVGCSSSHAGKFQWQEEEQAVVLRENVKERQKNRFSDSQKAKIRRRDNHQCVKCSSESTLRVHHIIPVDFGGDNNIENGATLCKPCHDKLHRWGNGYKDEYTTIPEFWTWTNR